MKKTLFAASLALILPILLHADGITVKNNEKIAFLGDSITAFGNNRPMGYIHLVIQGLKAVGVEAVAIPAGVSGNKSNDMLARLDRSVLEKKPDWMLLSCGVNDVWHQDSGRGIMLDDYKKNITSILDKAAASNVKVMILTPTMIQENPADKRNIKLAPYNEFLREEAKKRSLPIADLNADMLAKLNNEKHAGNRLTVDGVHMNAYGNMMMAEGILRAFGINEADIDKIRSSWRKIPGAVTIQTPFSIEESETLAAEAVGKKSSVQNIIRSRMLEERK